MPPHGAPPDYPTPAGEQAGPAAQGEHGLAARLRALLPSALAGLARLVRLPSVAWPGFDPAPVSATAAAVAESLRGLAIFDRVEVVLGEGPAARPAVLARREPAPGRPTVLLYAHHDVQPPGEEAEWVSPPFSPTLRAGRLHGRGAADDKAGIAMHLLALRLLAERQPPGSRELGLAVFIEGEEEAGSPSFAALLRDHAELLRAEVIVVADSGNWDERTPGITVSLRGNATFTVTLRTLDHAVHSGMYGGAVPDAMLALIRTLDGLWDEQGGVAVPGLHHHSASAPGYDEGRLREESGLREGVRPIGRGPLPARLWWQPAVTVTGIDAPAVAVAANSLQPLVRAKLSVRVAPGQSAEQAMRLVQQQLLQHAPFGAEIEFGDEQWGEPFLVDVEAPALRIAEAAMHDAWGVAPVRQGVGGSIPFIAELVAAMPGAQLLITGVEDPDSRAHSPNESLHLAGFQKAVHAEALLLLRLAAGAGGE